MRQRRPQVTGKPDATRRKLSARETRAEVRDADSAMSRHDGLVRKAQAFCARPIKHRPGGGSKRRIPTSVDPSIRPSGELWSPELFGRLREHIAPIDYDGRRAANCARPRGYSGEISMTVTKRAKTPGSAQLHQNQTEHTLDTGTPATLVR